MQIPVEHKLGNLINEVQKTNFYLRSGISETIQLAFLANQLNIQVVLGNGVATKIFNTIENWIFKRFDCFFGSSEANGMYKIIDTTQV